MITVFTIPKPFKAGTAVAQKNAIQSWLSCLGKCEVFLCGDDAGVAEAAAQFRLRHLGHIRRNEYGTPLLSDTFAQVANAATGSCIVYINADIILLSDIAVLLKQVPFRHFLMTGQRWDLDVNSPIDFSTDRWRTDLFENIRSAGQLRGPSAMDYFVFPRGTMWQLPDFAVGRPGWDNWMVFRAWVMGVPVIDATETVTIVHQNHAYGHVAAAHGNQWEGPEGDRNTALAGGTRSLFTLHEANWRLTSKGLVPISRVRQLHRVLDVWTTLHPRFAILYRMGHAGVSFGERLVAACRRIKGRSKGAAA